MSVIRRRSYSGTLASGVVLALLGPLAPGLPAAEVPQELRAWFGPHKWSREGAEPALSLGKPGDFDDTHIFGPSIIRSKNGYAMLYCGSRSSVSSRVFRLGFATSADGRTFTRHGKNPVWSFNEPNKSVLTPALLRTAEGEPILEDGRMRMWLSTTRFDDTTGLHTLHDTRSDDGLQWDAPSPPMAQNVYAPTVIKEGKAYRMWYVDPSRSPWSIRHAESADGSQWMIDEQPVLKVDQAWESVRLFYPFVLKVDGAYLMWYASYWAPIPEQSTAIGFAASLDGRVWHKHPANPVLKPDSSRFWETHYVSSHSVIRMADSSFRIWYASRKKPPFENKYFAISNASWKPVPPAPEQPVSGEGRRGRWPRLSATLLGGMVRFEGGDSAGAVEIFDLYGKRIVSVPMLSGRSSWDGTVAGRGQAGRGVYLARAGTSRSVAPVRFRLL